MKVRAWKGEVPREVEHCVGVRAPDEGVALDVEVDDVEGLGLEAVPEVGLLAEEAVGVPFVSVHPRGHGVFVVEAVYGRGAPERGWCDGGIVHRGARHPVDVIFGGTRSSTVKFKSEALQIPRMSTPYLF